MVANPFGSDPSDFTQPTSQPPVYSPAKPEDVVAEVQEVVAPLSNADEIGVQSREIKIRSDEIEAGDLRSSEVRAKADQIGTRADEIGVRAQAISDADAELAATRPPKNETHREAMVRILKEYNYMETDIPLTHEYWKHRNDNLQK